ncbi:MAG TPA: hypothetical protein VHB20_16160 [Verrucomicrobiae bacterium]|jgi:hypothetical protein|nr:hypothetical protein [Verrucomicrobiae bacterium]
MAAPSVEPSRQTAAPRRAKAYVGRAVFIYAYDVGYEMMRLPVPQLLGQTVAQFSVDTSKRSPRHLFFYRPQMVRLPPQERIGPNGPVRVEFSMKLLPVGALSITVSVPFEVDAIDELVGYHDFEFSNGSLSDEVRQLAEDARRELAPYLIKPVAQLAPEEAYTVFCLDAPLRAPNGATIGAEQWLEQHRREVAALLTQETDTARLSQQEVNESTGRYLSYYENDLAALDWDAALIVEEPQHFDEALYILELANLQLAELEAYDRLLDTALERSYRDLTQRPRRRGEVMRELREIRIDLARFSDELSNITKFFGDWHLARLYENIAARFHLGDWHRTIDEKLKTLDDLYQLLNQDRTNRWMLTLEVTIVLLFIIDLIILMAGAHPR